MVISVQFLKLFFLFILIKKNPIFFNKNKNFSFIDANDTYQIVIMFKF